MFRITIEDDAIVAEVPARVFQDTVVQFVYHRHGMRVDTAAATEILKRIGSAYPLPCELGMIFRGVILTSEEVRDALRPVLGNLLNLLRTAPHNRDIRLVGDGADLRGLTLLIAEETGRYIR